MLVAGCEPCGTRDRSVVDETQLGDVIDCRIRVGAHMLRFQVRADRQGATRFLANRQFALVGCVYDRPPPAAPRWRHEPRIPTMPASSARRVAAALALGLSLLAGCATGPTTTASPASKPIPVKVFVAAMFEIGQNSGDRAGEFQHWYERYWKDATPIAVPGAMNPVYCNSDGVCGSVLGMGKVNSSSSMQAILLNPNFDFSHAYYVISGVAGTPPSRGTIGEVNWATWLVDYDLGHRWAPEENKSGEPTFMPRKGYEEYRRFQLNPELVSWAMKLSADTPLKDSESARKYRLRY